MGKLKPGRFRPDRILFRSQRYKIDISPVYTTLNFWYGADKIGTRTTFLEPKNGTVPKIERSVNGAII